MKKVALFLLLFLIAIIIYSFISKPAIYRFEKVFLESENIEESKLKKIVDSVISSSKSRYGIYIKNLKTNEEYSHSGEEIFAPASLYKIWVMATVFEKIKTGALAENDPLPADIKALNKKFGFSEEDAELKSGILNFTVKSALEQMITISHNYATYALIEKVKRSEVEAFIKRYGLTNSTMGTYEDLKTTAFDIGMLLEKIYKGEIVDSEYSGKMIEILLRQQKNDRIPKNLPEGVKVAHKTGELAGLRNDAGIVYTPAGDYILVVLSENSDVVKASEEIATLSKAVYEYFNKW